MILGILHMNLELLYRLDELTILFLQNISFSVVMLPCKVRLSDIKAGVPASW